MTDKSGTPGMTTSSQQSDWALAKMPKPLIAVAGAGDLAVEKFRDLSQLAANRLSTLESDPSALADRVQVGIESRAGAVGNVVRSARTTVQGQAQELSEKAQSALQTAVSQAGDTYETLAKRGEGVVGRLRSPVSGTDVATPARQLEVEQEDTSAATSPSTAQSSASSATSTKSSAKSSTKSSTKSSSQSTRAAATRSTSRSAGKAGSRTSSGVADQSTTKSSPRKTSSSTATKRSES